MKATLSHLEMNSTSNTCQDATVTKSKGQAPLRVWNFAASPWPISEPEQIFGLWAGKKSDVLARGTLTDVVRAPADYAQGTC